MLSNDSYLQGVKNSLKSCKMLTAGTKLDIIMRLKTVITRDEDKCNKRFLKIWDHSGGCL